MDWQAIPSIVLPRDCYYIFIRCHSDLLPAFLSDRVTLSAAISFGGGQ